MVTTCNSEKAATPWNRHMRGTESLWYFGVEKTGVIRFEAQAYFDMDFKVQGHVFVSVKSVLELEYSLLGSSVNQSNDDDDSETIPPQNQPKVTEWDDEELIEKTPTDLKMSETNKTTRILVRLEEEANASNANNQQTTDSDDGKWALKPNDEWPQAPLGYKRISVDPFYFYTTWIHEDDWHSYLTMLGKTGTNPIRKFISYKDREACDILSQLLLKVGERDIKIQGSLTPEKRAALGLDLEQEEYDKATADGFKPRKIGAALKEKRLQGINSQVKTYGSNYGHTTIEVKLEEAKMTAASGKRASQLSQATVMGGISASNIASGLGWEQQRLSSGFFSSEWLHLLAFSWGGFMPAGAKSGFSTSETNSLMTRYEMAWQDFYRKEQKLYSKLAIASKEEPISLQGQLKVHCNDFSEPISFTINEVLVDEVEQAGEQNLGSEVPETMRELYNPLGDTTRTLHQDSRTPEAFTSEAEMLLIAHDFPAIVYSVEYMIKNSFTSILLDSKACADFSFFPFQRSLCHQAEAVLDALVWKAIKEMADALVNQKLGEKRTEEAGMPDWRSKAVRDEANLKKLDLNHARLQLEALNPDRDEDADEQRWGVKPKEKQVHRIPWTLAVGLQRSSADHYEAKHHRGKMTPRWNFALFKVDPAFAGTMMNMDRAALADAAPYWTIPVLLALTSLLTYFYTASGNKSRREDGIPTAPPQVPYWIPGIGNTLGFAFNTESFLSSIINQFGKVPMRMSIGGEPIYFIPQGPPILDLFKASRHLTTKSLAVPTARDAFGCPPSDLGVYVSDDSGTDAKPLPGWEHIDPAQRFHFAQHRDLHALLTGSSLKAMTEKFVDVYSDMIEMDSRFTEGGWTEVDDLYALLKDSLLRAALQALCGEKFLELSPTFPEDFWAFDYHLPNLFKRLPKWLVPKSHRARDRALEGVLRYHQYGRQHMDFMDPAVLKQDWTPEFGARLMSARQKMFSTTGLSPRATASLDLGLLWAVNANAIPAAMWMLLGILLDDNIKDRVTAEMQPAFYEKSLSFDIDRLCAGPLLNSIYCETLRIRVAAPVGRASLIPDLQFGKWRLTKGVGMLSTSWVGGHDQDFWNTGHIMPDGSAEHPVDSFWAERFLRYKDEPATGPIRNSGSGSTAGGKTPKRAPDDDKNARLVTEGLQAYWYPYGGGTKMCPGRFFAKQELMAGVAVVLRAYEIELLDREAAGKTVPNMDYFPFGTIPPKGKIAARIRRRKL
ncbi:hypothetical protein AK830_g7698 [Neonectria ditissima]|uniref:Cholesterol 7-alpha-monooxygenase n=1 Tax=Neonectria ditissima TaxID=78410 RepID=A0A0P7AZ19_9HYPO|nr:hypothetical protein AK830_g7698 [Neonectria ditissima]